MTRRLRPTLVSHRTTRWPDGYSNHAKEGTSHGRDQERKTKENEEEVEEPEEEERMIDR